MGPVLAALIVVPFGQPSIAWFSNRVSAIVILWRIGIWYTPHIAARKFACLLPASGRRAGPAQGSGSRWWCWWGCCSPSSSTFQPSSYYIFYLIDNFGALDPGRPALSLHLPRLERGRAFFGGPLGDRFGRKYVIWFSILGALPFTLALPYAGLVMRARC